MHAGLRIAPACRAVERLTPAPGDPDPFYEALLAVLERCGLRFRGACWHLTDPVTGLFTWTGSRGELPGDFLSAIENEFLEDDVAKYADIAARRAPVAALVDETGGEPERSARFRRQFARDGFGDELRLVFADGYGRWGSMGIFAEQPFRLADRTAMAQLVPLVAGALRAAVARCEAALDDGAPGVLVLDPGDRVRSRDARADELLAGCAKTGALPGAVHVLAAQARMAGRSAHGRTLDHRGAWLALDASPLVGDPGSIAVVLRPATPVSVFDVRLRAAGLSERERQIALAVLRGDDTAAIAAGLHLSPWTVQDHLKSIFDKTGVRSRRAFVAHWALPAAGAA